MRLNHIIIIGALCGALLIPSSASSWGTMGGTFSAGARGSSCTETCSDYLVCQNFEGTGYDNSETWNESVGSGGSANEDDTTAPVGRGSQQLRLVGGNAGADTTSYVDFGSQSGHMWFHFKYRTQDATPGYNCPVVTIAESTNTRMLMELRTTGVIRLYSGGVSMGDTTTIMSDNTWVHVWLHHYPGAGSGIAELYISSTNIRPESPEITNSSVTNDHAVTRIILRGGQNTGASYIATNDFDQVYADNAEITDVCE